ncbi:YkgJ family cysteine cluster protein [Amylibacter sp. IMCC11727]|uniref:YkgJ family cysteine cluster protein n=1 Tax=Amylibacter sp. IMCC11727 TaxID=3039851 RepID=UPI00244DC624|nr:YkgJ family cysteine cluster protein [Amylibacter sp. IMCC11727]WGI22576.1 YkgJ family cysteine cluster protein [Amylibacter sp. IMCC11727]
MTDSTLASDLCVSCQMCCNGSLFKSISISATEARRLEQHQPGMCNGSTTDLSLPCIALSRFEGCTAYHIRPKSCAVFSCSVLHRAQIGAITKDKAQALIAQLKDLKDTADHAGGEEAKQAKVAFKKLLKTAFLRA